MKVKYRPAAIADIFDTCDYITEKLKNPEAAESLKLRLLDSISLLKDNPYMGELLVSRFDELDSKLDYRFLIVSKQLVFYRVEEEIIEVVRILDSRTDYLSILLQ